MPSAVGLPSLPQRGVMGFGDSGDGFGDSGDGFGDSAFNTKA
ncbi:MAG: hypothetical protein OQJ97_17410 [Rhodospirillales bacterium]|nr:hypothetical protein [Rhodospirillales bacterium]